MDEWWTQTATIYRAEAAGGVYSTSALLATVLCSEITPTTQSDRLRAGQADDAVSLMLIYSEVPTETGDRPRPDDRLRLDSVDYRIRHVMAWPATRAEFLEIYIEDEGKTY